jgi:FMN-dependent NADH-azoreductase
MYNFQIPSSLKAYLDHVVRVNKTFQYNDGKYQGLLKNKRCYILTTMGGRKAGTIQEQGFENYLRNILEFIGVHDTILFCIDGTTDPGYATEVLTETKNKITNSISIL